MLYSIAAMNVHLVSLGCPKNQVDGELMLGLLRPGRGVAGGPGRGRRLRRRQHLRLHRPGEAGVDRHDPRARPPGRAGPPAGAWSSTGCLPQRYGAELLTELPEVDALVGTGELPRIVDVVRRLDARDDWVASAPPGYVYRAACPARASRPRFRTPT